MDNFQETLKNLLEKVDINDNNIIEENDNSLEDIKKDISRLMISLRSDLNMTQLELAKLAGTSQANICTIETGKGLPKISTLNNIAKALNKKLVILFDDIDEYY